MFCNLLLEITLPGGALPQVLPPEQRNPIRSQLQPLRVRQRKAAVGESGELTPAVEPPRRHIDNPLAEVSHRKSLSHLAD